MFTMKFTFDLEIKPFVAFRISVCWFSYNLLLNMRTIALVVPVMVFPLWCEGTGGVVIGRYTLHS